MKVDQLEADVKDELIWLNDTDNKLDKLLASAPEKKPKDAQLNVETYDVGCSIGSQTSFYTTPFFLKFIF